MNKDLIQPAEILGFGQCQNCGGPLVIHDCEILCLTLSKDGEPIKNDMEYNSCSAKCLSCGEVFAMVKDGMKYVPFSPFLKAIKDTQTRTTVISNIKKPNPFSIED